MAAPSPLNRRLALWLTLFGLALLVFRVMIPFLAPLVWAGILAYVSWPLAQWVRCRCGGRDTLAASLCTLLAALILFGPLLWLAWLAQGEVSRFYPDVQAFLAAPPPIPNWVLDLPWLGDGLRQLRTQLVTNPQEVIAAGKTWLMAHAGEAAALAGGAGKNLFKLVFLMFILFLFYRDGARILGELRHILERFLGTRAHDYLTAVGTTTRAVVYGVLFTALVQGIVAGAGYAVAGLSSPVTLGVLTALLALIPFGTTLAWGSAGALLLVRGDLGAAIGIWIWGAAVVSQIDNVLRPLFISSVSDIPFLLVLFGVLGGLLAFGLVGLFAGPIVLAMALAVWREWMGHLDEKEIPS
jgi:predicted PurR-regulated permease PerM